MPSAAGEPRAFDADKRELDSKKHSLTGNGRSWRICPQRRELHGATDSGLLVSSIPDPD
jgi:hypothetical protein